MLANGGQGTSGVRSEATVVGTRRLRHNRPLLKQATNASVLLEGPQSSEANERRERLQAVNGDRDGALTQVSRREAGAVRLYDRPALGGGPALVERNSASSGNAASEISVISRKSLE
jgi:hypothetical protein